MTSQGFLDEDRLRGRNRLRTEPKSIVLIALKHELDPLLLADAILEAYAKGTQHLGALEITHRKENKDRNMFLLTENGKTVSQFPIGMDLLLNPRSLKSFVANTSIPDHFRKKSLGQLRNIEELRFGMKRINVGARIVEIPPKRLVTTEYGSQLFVSNATVADDTGTIRLSLWNDEIEKFHVGDQVHIENCYVSSFGGRQQLRMGRNGAISIT